MAHLPATDGKVTPERIGPFGPTDEFREQLQENRKELTNRVFGCLYADLPGDDDGSFMPGTTNKKTA